MPWLIIKTEHSKEWQVKTMIEGIYLEPYIPTEYREYRQGKSRRRRVKEVPLIPRLVFALLIHPVMEEDVTHQLRTLKYVTGLLRNAQGSVFMVRDTHMAQFMETVCTANVEQRRAYAMKDRPKGQKPKLKSFAALREYFDDLEKQGAPAA